MLDVPRLLVYSDVSVEQTAGGALVLHRLLSDYPPDRLFVASYPTRNWNGPVGRLPGVTYTDESYRIPRLIWNRYNPFWPVVMAKYTPLRAGDLARRVAAFRPQAVLSVAHDYLWFAAAVVAARFRVPFHLILHDDWPSLQTLSQSPRFKPMVRRACERLLGQVCRQASTRLCVSQGMAELYASRFGVPFHVLHPSRGNDSPTPVVRLREQPASRPMAVAYCGLIHQEWTVRALQQLADTLASGGGRLDLFVPYPKEQIGRWGLDRPNIRLVGFVPAYELAERVPGSAELLFLPASFQPEERVNISTLFPSKLADYTAIGLPILVWGPEYSSAARWALERPGATFLVTDPDPRALATALSRAAVPEAARQVAAAGIAAGIESFDGRRVRDQFLAFLTKPQSAGPLENQP